MKNRFFPEIQPGANPLEFFDIGGGRVSSIIGPTTTANDLFATLTLLWSDEIVRVANSLTLFEAVIEKVGILAGQTVMVNEVASIGERASYGQAVSFEPDATFADLRAVTKELFPPEEEHLRMIEIFGALVNRGLLSGVRFTVTSESDLISIADDVTIAFELDRLRREES